MSQHNATSRNHMNNNFNEFFSIFYSICFLLTFFMSLFSTPSFYFIFFGFSAHFPRFFDITMNTISVFGIFFWLRWYGNRYNRLKHFTITSSAILHIYRCYCLSTSIRLNKKKRRKREINYQIHRQHKNSNLSKYFLFCCCYLLICYSSIHFCCCFSLRVAVVQVLKGNFISLRFFAYVSLFDKSRLNQAIYLLYLSCNISLSHSLRACQFSHYTQIDM